MDGAAQLLFDGTARRLGMPGLTPHLRERLNVSLPIETFKALEQVNLDALFLPIKLTDAIEFGSAGVITFSEAEMFAVFGSAELVKEADPDARSWQFWRTEDGSFALFPRNGPDDEALVVTAVVRSGSTVQLRRFRTSLRVANGGLVDVQGSPSVEPENCVHEIDVHEPGAPYVGRCTNHGCGDGCTPAVVVNPDDGLYYLEGCKC